MTNFKAQQEFLNSEANIDSINNDLANIEKYLSSNATLISYAINISPLSFAEKISSKLEQLKKFASIEQLNTTILICEDKLNQYKIFLMQHEPEAKIIAEDIEKLHKQSIETYVNPIKSKDATKIQNIMYTGLNSEQTTENVFQKSLRCYIETLKELCVKINEPNEQLNHFIETTQDSKYSSNSIVQLFLNDDDFLEKLKEGEFFNQGEIGHVILQRFFSMNNQNNLQWRTMFNKLSSNPIFCNHITPKCVVNSKEEKTFFQYDEDTFKNEIIKLELYKRLPSQHTEQPVAWIGSATSIMELLKQKESPNHQITTAGIFLNCDDDKWSLELNRAWVIALVHMGYQIKLVEQQFPNIKQAFKESDEEHRISCFLVALFNEVRPMDEDNTKKNHSQYNGGDSPTATSLEILLLLGLGCDIIYNANNKDISLSMLTPSKSSLYKSPQPRKAPFTPSKLKITHSTPNTPIPSNSATHNNLFVVTTEDNLDSGEARRKLF